MDYEEQLEILYQFQDATGLGTLAANVVLTEFAYNLEEALEYTKTFDYKRRFDKNSLSIKK